MREVQVAIQKIMGSQRGVLFWETDQEKVLPLLQKEIGQRK